MCRKMMIVAAVMAAVLAVSPSLFAQDTQVQGMNAELNQISNVGGTTLNRSSVDADAAAAAKADAAAAAKVVDSGNSSNSNVNSNDSGGGTGTGVGLANITQTFENQRQNMSPVNPGYSPLVWPAPKEENAFPFNSIIDLLSFERKWTQREINGLLLRTQRGPIEGLRGLLGGHPEIAKGFFCQVDLMDGSRRPRSKAREFATIFVQDVNVPDFLKKYEKIGRISVVGIKTRTPDSVVAWAVNEALKYDLDVGLLTIKANKINSATGTGGGAGLVSAGGVSNTFALIGSTNTSDIKVAGEVVAIAIVYRKIGPGASKKGSLSPELQKLLLAKPKPKAETQPNESVQPKIEGVDGINPEIVKKAYPSGVPTNGNRKN